jgi:radical SAM-linked protein
VGITGIHEPIDIVLSPPVPIDDVKARIAAKLPPGITLHSVAEVPYNAPALQGLLIGADYAILLFAEAGELESATVDTAIHRLLAQTEIWRERQRKGEQYTYNLRPLIFELQNRGYDAEREEHHIFLRVQQRPGATGRPDEVVAALGLDNHARTLRRDRLYYADRSEDMAIFAAYPVIEQSAINVPRPLRRDARAPRPQQNATTPRPPAGRSISERAGDEFA